MRVLVGRIRDLRHELAKFGAVGLLAYVLDLACFNVSRVGVGLGPLTSKCVSVMLAATVAYVVNRWWTFRHRAHTGVRREYGLFVVLNAGGLAISLCCLGFSHYVLRLTSPLADNIAANVVGLALATAFRFWSYRRFVFLEPEAAEPMTPNTSRTAEDVHERIAA